MRRGRVWSGSVCYGKGGGLGAVRSARFGLVWVVCLDAAGRSGHGMACRGSVRCVLAVKLRLVGSRWRTAGCGKAVGAGFGRVGCVKARRSRHG